MACCSFLEVFIEEGIIILLLLSVSHLIFTSFCQMTGEDDPHKLKKTQININSLLHTQISEGRYVNKLIPGKL